MAEYLERWARTARIAGLAAIAAASAAYSLGLGGCDYLSQKKFELESRMNKDEIEIMMEFQRNSRAISSNDCTLNENLNTIYQNFLKEGRKPKCTTRDKDGNPIPSLYVFILDINSNRIPVKISAFSGVGDIEHPSLIISYGIRGRTKVSAYSTYPHKDENVLAINCDGRGIPIYPDLKSNATSILQKIIDKALQNQASNIPLPSLDHLPIEKMSDLFGDIPTKTEKIKKSEFEKTVEQSREDIETLHHKIE